MATLPEVEAEVVSQRARIKALEQRVASLERVEPVSQAAKEADITSQHGSEANLASGKVLTILSRGVQHTCDEEDWFLKLFPGTCLYTLPPGAIKNGRAAVAVFDPILTELVRKSRSGSAVESSLYRAFAAEWPTLFQSITYQVIQAEALSEFIVLAEAQESESGSENFLSSVIPDLYRLLLISTNLLDDQTKRASVLIAAAKKSVAAASLVANQFVSEFTGIHPSAESVYASVKSGPEFSQQAQATKPAGSKKKWIKSATSSTASTAEASKSPAGARKAKHTTP